MSLMREFREFALKGNVVDLAVGVIIGAAFGKIVDSLVKNVLMPPIGYVIVGLFALLFGWFFYAYLGFFVRASEQMQMGGQTPNVNQQMVRGVLLNSAVIILFVMPMITMRTYSEEKRSGTIELLLTSPITDVQIILGKFLGAMLLYASMLAVTMITSGVLGVAGQLMTERDDGTLLRTKAVPHGMSSHLLANVLISLNSDFRGAEISVSDDGIGFDPSLAVRAAHDGGADGSGFGLRLVERLTGLAVRGELLPEHDGQPREHACAPAPVARAAQPRMINQAATLGFSANALYANTRCETFVAWWTGAEDLFNDLFTGDAGVFVYEVKAGNETITAKQVVVATGSKARRKPSSTPFASAFRRASRR